MQIVITESSNRRWSRGLGWLLNGFVVVALFSLGTVCHAATLNNYFNFINIGSTNGVTNGVGGSLTISDHFGTNATVKTAATTLDSAGLAIAAGNNAGTTGVLLPPEAISGFTNDFTVQIWYTSPAAIVANTMVFGGTTTASQDGNLTGDQALFAGYVTSFIRPIIGNNTTFGVTLNPPNGTGTATSTLYNYVITYTAATKTFTTYMNGTQVGTPLSVAYFNGLAGLANGIAIGGVQTPAFGDNAAAVTVSDFLIYSGTLSSAQVSAIHSLGVGASVSSIEAALLPPSALTWNGAGGDDNWGTGANWVGGTAPGALVGNDLIFAGSTRTTPNMQTNYLVGSLMFSNNASSFTLGASGGHTLTLGGSLTNSSANLQTLNLPISLSGAATFDAGTGGLTVNSNIIGGGSLTKVGNGTLTLAGTNTYAGATAVNGGKLNLATSGVLPDGTTVTLGTSGTLELNAVSETITRLNLNDATLTQTNGALTLTQGGDFGLRLGDTAGSTATYNLSVGSLTLTVGNANFGGLGSGTFNQTGGSVTTASWTVIGRNTGGTGLYDISAGTLTHSNTATRLYVGENGTGTLNISGSAMVQTTGGVRVGNTGGAGTVNLDGGTLQTPFVEAGNVGASQTFYFNGGTLKAGGNSTTFIANMDTLEIRNGGAIIDDNGNTITIGQTIAHSSVGGDDATDGGLTKLGNGTLTLSGGYSHTGPTVVRAGTLKLDAAQTSSASALTVSNATLSLLLNDGFSSINSGNLTFQGNTTLNLDYGTATTPFAAAIYANGYTVSNTGTNIINITGINLVVGQYPIIYTGGSVPTNNFVLGSMPVGMVAVLTNSGVSLDLLVTATGQNLTWYGADNLGNPLTTWDINTSSNWNFGNAKYLQYAGNSYGDYVTFDDNVFGPSSADITLNSTVVPASVNFNNYGTPYSITGSGSIGGATALVKSGAASVHLGTANTYTGGTVVNEGTLSVASDSALGASSGAVSLNGATLQFSNTTASVRGITVTTNSTVDVVPGANAQLAGVISGAAGLSKTGDGTLTLAGANTYSAATTVAGGTLSVPTGGVISNASGNFAVGTIAGTDATLSISGGSVSDSTTTGNAWASYLQVGNGADFRGSINLSAGSLNAQRHLILGNNGGYGAMTINSGTLTVGSYFIPGFGASSVGVFNQTGGTVIQNQASGAGATLIGSGNGAVGVMNLSGGTFTATAGGIFLPENGTATGILTISGTADVAVGNVGVRFGNSASAVSGTLNLLGGTLTANVLQHGGGDSTVNFNGGTLRAGAASGAFMNGLTRATVYGGGAVLDDGGFAVTIAQPLLAPEGYGVSSITLADGGSGYIAPPVVTISGGIGSNATAIAQISAAGVVTNIVVTSPGTGYDSSDILFVSFTGGGGTSIATANTPVLVANTSGGLTKIGNGTLTLSGVSTYTGPTRVNAGALAGTGTITGPLTNNATLAPGSGGSGAMTINGNITLNAASTNLFSVNGTTPANTSVIAGGNVTYGGVLKIVPGGTFTLGQTFTLFSGAGATSASNFASIEGSPGSGLAFGFTNGVLSVVTGTVSNPTNITWNVSGGSLNLSWPATHAGWILQVQTNSRSVGLSSNWFDVPNSGSVTSTNFPVGPASPTVFYRLRNP